MSSEIFGFSFEETLEEKKNASNIVKNLGKALALSVFGGLLLAVSSSLILFVLASYFPIIAATIKVFLSFLIG